MKKGIISETGIRKHLFVKDIMNNPVIRINEDESVVEVAKLMTKHNLGSIIVTNKKGKPTGIITERDLVERVVAKNVKSSKISTKQVMTSPIITAKPKETVTDAAKIMNRQNVRRLVIVNKGDLVGIVTSKDILRVMPELIEIIQEENKIEPLNILDESKKHPKRAGYCDDCGEWSDTLEEVNGEYLCEECRDECDT